MTTVFLHTDESIPKSEVKEPNMEYAKLWMEQSKLMWSRLQFIHLLHASVLGGWLLLNKSGYPIPLQIGALLIGLPISKYFLTIVWRDGEYMNELRTLSNGAIPEVDKKEKRLNGRKCAKRIIIFLCLIEVLLVGAIAIFYYFPDFIHFKELVHYKAN